MLQYHYEYLQKAFIKGKLYSFLFNNFRVKLMNDRLKQRKDVLWSLIKNEKQSNYAKKKVKFKGENKRKILIFLFQLMIVMLKE